MTGLFHAHSGLRYLVLLAAVAAIAYFGFGLVSKRPAGKGVRVMGAIYLGLLDLQVLLGIALVFMRPWYPRLAGHIAMMLVAAAVAHVTTAVNRRRPQPGFMVPFIGVVVSLLLIVGGIFAIRASLFAKSGV